MAQKKKTAVSHRYKFENLDDLYIYLGEWCHAAWPVESSFPDQGANPGPQQ